MQNYNASGPSIQNRSTPKENSVTNMFRPINFPAGSFPLPPSGQHRLECCPRKAASQQLHENPDHCHHGKVRKRDRVPGFEANHAGQNLRNSGQRPSLQMRYPTFKHVKSIISDAHSVTARLSFATPRIATVTVFQSNYSSFLKNYCGSMNH